jgi:hypothetical protein
MGRVTICILGFFYLDKLVIYIQPEKRLPSNPSSWKKSQFYTRAITFLFRGDFFSREEMACEDY